MNIINVGKSVFDTEIVALELVKNDIGEIFEQILKQIVNCRGKVIISGMGKSGHVARKISATMSSLGVPSIFLHPAEAAHGDLGIVQPADIVIAISYSGESNEITVIIPSIRKIGALLIGITCNPNSTLAKSCDIAQIFPEFKEACHLGLAPTSSTTAVMVYGDALAVAASEFKNYTSKDFGVFHPAGSLGKRLVFRVCDIMKNATADMTVNSSVTIKDAIIALGASGLGKIAVIDDRRKLIGVLTDGIVRRALDECIDIYSTSIEKYICYDAVFVNTEDMAYEALKIMDLNGIASVPVLREYRVAGIIKAEDITHSGIYL